jgi:hypothetical protein
MNEKPGLEPGFFLLDERAGGGAGHVALRVLSGAKAAAASWTFVVLP